jgi:transcriptional regulator with XRE-family HTH domain
MNETIQQNNCIDKRESGYYYPRMNRDDVIQRLQLMKGERMQTELAIDLGISAQYLGDVLSGKRDPGKAILDALRLEKVISYQPLKGKRK